MSEHPPLAYTGEFYANMLLGFLRDVVKRPAVVVAHGLAANIATRAAADVPELFSRLVLVSPNVEAGIDLDPKPTQLLARAAQRTSLGLVPYAFLSTKPLLRRLAHRRSALTGDDVAREESVEHLYASAHQFGGQHALLALMTGELDLPIQNIFPLLQPPVLLVSGDEDPGASGWRDGRPGRSQPTCRPGCADQRRGVCVRGSASDVHRGAAGLAGDGAHAPAATGGRATSHVAGGCHTCHR